VLTYEALLTVLKQTTLARRFEALSSVRHKTFGELTHAWHSMLERSIAARLGEPQQETEAA
jgi:hypothetical protein